MSLDDDLELIGDVVLFYTQLKSVDTSFYWEALTRIRELAKFGEFAKNEALAGRSIPLSLENLPKRQPWVYFDPEECSDND